ncbi:hypothetical protein C0J52_16799 [Blattella germanica]|nr:hypothetical protein C0J52_16799 [Blattella germanica]
MSITELSNIKWLLFMDSQPLENYFEGIYIPLDSQFIVARHFERTITFTEVYRVGKMEPLRTNNVGEWRSSDKGPRWTTLTFYSRRGDLQGVRVKAAVISDGAICNIMEFVNKKPIKIGGFFGFLWMALESRLNFTSDYFTPEDGGYGSLHADTWSGMIGMLVRKEVDFAIGAYVMTEQLTRYVNFLSPMGATKITVFVRPTSTAPGTSWTRYLAPFNADLWITILAALILLALCLSTVSRIGCNTNKSDAENYTFYNSLLYIFGSFCQQGKNGRHEGTPQSWPCRFMYLSAYLTAVVVLAAYSAIFISFLTVRHIYTPFTTFEDILREGTYKLGILQRSVELNFFDQTAKDSVLHDVYNQLILPTLDESISDTLTGLQRVCIEPNFGFVCDSTRAASVMNKVTCQLVAVSQAFIPATGTFIIGKHSPYRRIINNNLESMRRHGELGRLFVHAMPANIYKDSSDSSLIHVRIQQVIPVLTILFASIIVATIFLFAERYAFHGFSPRRRKRARNKHC